MASTNKTQNYGLSQYLGSDKPTYLGDYNSDMNKIDTQMKANADGVEEVEAKATTATENASLALEKANSADEKATSAGATATEANQKASQSVIDIETINSKLTQIQTWTEPVDIKSGRATGGYLNCSYNSFLKLMVIEGMLSANVTAGTGNVIAKLPNESLYPTQEKIIYSIGQDTAGSNVNLRIQPNGDIIYQAGPTGSGDIGFRIYNTLNYNYWN